ncbi:RNA polymerase sigma factor [Ktedonosporobacter rubrisoli]|uniref:RNA polymerase sigma factor n=1 Tax=Ktedonosporobacter rubrisoli TaxID=2509675 RepID=A0A4P6JQF0_KTERU|nr:RNA polymerase sigma factor [Ktedonosporobacter rubrisoli]QBD77648.1 RNA polymerase sigma factor [Ktedonosporobacter rubrisoli]
MDICEDELIKRAINGDQEAFRRLWELHHAVAMATALRLCHQRSLAEEITQGAFVLAWKGLPGFRAGCPFRPWLMRILYRHALDTMERQRSYLRPISLDILTEDIASSCTETHLLEQLEQREEIRHVLAQLSADQRRVIALRYGADLTEVDIAQVLGWPIGTVKSRLNRARERCRALLSRERK